MPLLFLLFQCKIAKIGIFVRNNATLYIHKTRAKQPQINN